LQKAVVVGLEREVASYSAADLVLRDVDLLPAALLLRLAAAILRVQPRDFELSQPLAGVDAVADIDVDVARTSSESCPRSPTAR
jgi:hypothetical protein